MKININAQTTGLFLGPIISLFLIFFVNIDANQPSIVGMLAVVVLMATWWITEAVPLAVTALLPIFLYPALGIMNGKAVSSVYYNHIIFLFLGAFMIALAMQKWNLHKRIALKILSHVGLKPKNILFGFMIATFLLSMWISNTATAMMMIPIAIAILNSMETTMSTEALDKYSKAIYLGIAYSASVGGVATLIGTPPNLIFSRIFNLQFPKAPEIIFSDWMFFALPVSTLFFFLVWGLLTFLFCPKKTTENESSAEEKAAEKNVIISEVEKLGKISYEEKCVLVVFTALVTLWLFRNNISLGSFTVPGWSTLSPNLKLFNDGTVSVFLAIILFLIPSKNCPSGRIMDWGSTIKLPWNIVLLFGGGFALAAGFKESGLALWIAEELSILSTFPPLLIVAGICLVITFLTEVSSNTATAQIFLPILAALSVALKVHPLILMLPATICCSFAFMLPAATPPNAIVFSAGKLRVADMARIGLFLNIFSVILITLYTYFLGDIFLDRNLDVFPVWARFR